MSTNRRASGRTQRRHRDTTRRGMSLMIVMVAISTSVVLTFAFLRTQATVRQISQNSLRRDLALEAAEAGAHLALERLHSPEWDGVSEKLSRIVSTSAEGRAEFTVRFEPWTAGESTVPADGALHLVVRSTGIWQSAVAAADRVERHVEVVVRLLPRAAGRSVGPGDSAAAEDVAANPGDFDQIQTYSVFAGGGGDSLTLDPGCRLEGRIWVYDNLELFEAPYWSTEVRRDLLESIGSSLVSGNGSATAPRHPLPGEVSFYRNPSGSDRHDLERMRTTWSQSSNRLSLDSHDDSAWRRYRLFAGGFEYQAVELGSTLRNVTLRPTPENPLGIFYRSGNLRLDDHVTVQGTLIVTGNLEFDGDHIQVTAFNWCGEDGDVIAPLAKHWPRLPAVVAQSVEFDDTCRVLVHGAVMAQSRIEGEGSIYELTNAPHVSWTGTATCRRLGQPRSRVQLSGTPNLLSLNDRGDYAIWLERDGGGDWYPIVGIDAASRQLTILGEVDQPTAVSYRIARARRSSVDLFGPVATADLAVDRPDTWGVLSYLHWYERHYRWDEENDDRRRREQSPIEFVDWLADASNWSGWLDPYSTYGLSLEPTFHARPTPGISYRRSPPIFEPYTGTGSQQPYAGYRWKILSWREVR